jgi:hypothetical protein
LKKKRHTCTFCDRLIMINGSKRCLISSKIVDYVTGAREYQTESCYEKNRDGLCPDYKKYRSII